MPAKVDHDELAKKRRRTTENLNSDLVSSRTANSFVTSRETAQTPSADDYHIFDKISLFVPAPASLSRRYYPLGACSNNSMTLLNGATGIPSVHSHPMRVYFIACSFCGRWCCERFYTAEEVRAELMSRNSVELYDDILVRLGIATSENGSSSSVTRGGRGRLLEKLKLDDERRNSEESTRKGRDTAKRRRQQISRKDNNSNNNNNNNTLLIDAVPTQIPSSRYNSPFSYLVEEDDDDADNNGNGNRNAGTSSNSKEDLYRHAKKEEEEDIVAEVDTEGVTKNEKGEDVVDDDDEEDEPHEIEEHERDPYVTSSSSAWERLHLASAVYHSRYFDLVFSKQREGIAEMQRRRVLEEAEGASAQEASLRTQHRQLGHHEQKKGNQSTKNGLGAASGNALLSSSSSSSCCSPQYHRHSHNPTYFPAHQTTEGTVGLSEAALKSIRQRWCKLTAKNDTRRKSNNDNNENNINATANSIDNNNNNNSKSLFARPEAMPPLPPIPNALGPVHSVYLNTFAADTLKLQRLLESHGFSLPDELAPWGAHHPSHLVKEIADETSCGGLEKAKGAVAENVTALDHASPSNGRGGATKLEDDEKTYPAEGATPKNGDNSEQGCALQLFRVLPPLHEDDTTKDDHHGVHHNNNNSINTTTTTATTTSSIRVQSPTATATATEKGSGPLLSPKVARRGCDDENEDGEGDGDNSVTFIGMREAGGPKVDHPTSRVPAADTTASATTTATTAPTITAAGNNNNTNTNNKSIRDESSGSEAKHAHLPSISNSATPISTAPIRRARRGEALSLPSEDKGQQPTPDTHRARTRSGAKAGGGGEEEDGVMDTHIGGVEREFTDDEDDEEGGLLFIRNPNTYRCHWQTCLNDCFFESRDPKDPPSWPKMYSMPPCADCGAVRVAPRYFNGCGESFVCALAFCPSERLCVGGVNVQPLSTSKRARKQNTLGAPALTTIGATTAVGLTRGGQKALGSARHKNGSHHQNNDEHIHDQGSRANKKINGATPTNKRDSGSSSQAPFASTPTCGGGLTSHNLYNASPSSPLSPPDGPVNALLNVTGASSSLHTNSFVPSGAIRMCTAVPSSVSAAICTPAAIEGSRECIRSGFVASLTSAVIAEERRAEEEEAERTRKLEEEAQRAREKLRKEEERRQQKERERERREAEAAAAATAATAAAQSRKRAREEAAAAVAAAVVVPPSQPIAPTSTTTNTVVNNNKVHILDDDENDESNLLVASSSYLPPPPSLVAVTSSTKASLDAKTEAKQRKERAKAEQKATEAAAKKPQKKEKVSTAGRGRGGGGGRGKRKSSVNEDDDEDEEETVNWAQCDACRQWRIVTYLEMQRVEREHTKGWVCTDWGRSCSELDDEKQQKLRGE